ncbi:MAG TPA: tetratricopeptide repeat protein [Gammaproteobacteria bacterium]|nr:tetratricopeptide repeat protein [Gammaproteobacteria bacterium]
MLEVKRVDQTEEEQLERLKEWWSKNGKFVIAGLVVGLASVVGMRLWTETRNSEAEAASQQYEQLLGLVGQGNFGQAEQIAGTLLTEYSSTPYASLAKLMLAKIKLEQGDRVAAATFLRQVMDNSGQDEIREIARLRLARVLLADGKADAALSVIEGAELPAIQADAEIIKGDIYLAQGKRAEARAAYERAMVLGAENRRLLQMKLDDLAMASGDVAAQ